jgi:amino acid transporter
MATETITPANSNANGRFGMFAGVFTPNVLTILGIILFLRLGWVVGQVGLWGALIIVLLANLISLLTGLSLSSIATNMDVKAGGTYYLISRTLGLEIGGAIGIPLFLSQAISVAFYIIGFTEALSSIPFFQQVDPRLISTAIALLFGLISYIGADFALKIQYFILAVLIAALVSFFGGGWDTFQAPVIGNAFSEGISYWVVFAVFFPAVTGIAVGVSMSGDLKNPSQDIPRGTILSIVVTAVIYIMAVIWFATHLTADTLISENLAMQLIARWPVLILAGVWASTLSSALGSILAAPRTLQAIAFDKVVPRWMGSRMGSPTEPRAAILLSTIIAVGIIWLGDLNLVAPIISMFFLNTYGMLNLVAGIERLVGNPSFRPRFKIPWFLSMLGALGCYGVMLLINTPATIVAILISYGIYFMLARRRIEYTWGDVRSGILFTLARNILLRLDMNELDVRNWRPNIIVFTGQPHNRHELVEVANWLTLGLGIVTFFQLITGDVDQLIQRGVRRTARRSITKYIRDNHMEAFAEVEIVSSFKDGALSIAQAHGIGGLESNSVLMGWSSTQDGRTMQMNLMRNLVGLRKSILFLHPDPVRGFGNKQVIDVWWQGRGGNADLMLMMAHLIQKHRDWYTASIRLMLVVDQQSGVEEAKSFMVDRLTAVRVTAIPTVIVRKNKQEPVAEVIRRNSLNTDLTILGMRVPDANAAEAYGDRLTNLVSAVGTVLLIHNAQPDEVLLMD